jgi:hypothetical protein
MTDKTIKQVLQEHSQYIISLPGVVGIAQGNLSGKPCIRVFVIQKTPELLRQIPSHIEGYEVSIEESGEFKALTTE